MSDTLQKNAALANWLHERLTAWEQARKPQELKMIECYQDVMRIPRPDEAAGTGVARARKATSLFIGSSRNKVRASRAKINDALFGAGKLPFDTTPTNEQLAPYADAVEDILTDQFERMKFKSLLKAGVNTLAKYGTGFIFGPFVREESIKEIKVNNDNNFTELKEEEYAFDMPYFELGNTLDVYPDSEARSIHRSIGTFWVTMESPHTVGAWKDDKSYDDIDAALMKPGDDGVETGLEIATQLRCNVDYWHKEDRIKVARYFGKVPKRLLSSADGGDADHEMRDATSMVGVTVIMAGGVVIKVSESPYAYCPVLRCAYEDEEDEMWGVGVAENNSPHQKVTNAAFRLFMEGKGMALLGTSSVDRSKFLPSEDFKKFPGKVYQMKPGLSPDERKEAIVHHIEPDITGGWVDVIRMSEQFSDDDTGITKYTQGDDSSNLNKTASGISMIMSASSLPIKEVIQNIDTHWIEEIVQRTMDWNLKYLEVDTVERIHGKETADLWRQIKALGKTSFMDWKATGVSSFMQKEILVNKIRAFADFALSNPNTAPLIDARELLNQTWDVMEIGKESPVLEAEGGGKIPPQVQQQMQQMQEQIKEMGEALNNASAQVDKLEADSGSKDAELRLKEAELKIKAYEADTKRIAALGTGMSAEEVQALIIQTIQSTMQQPTPMDDETQEIVDFHNEQMQGGMEQEMPMEQEPMMAEEPQMLEAPQELQEQPPMLDEGMPPPEGMQ